MGNTLVLWPEVEVENSGSGCAHEIEIKPAPETRRSAARLTEAKLGNTLLETHRIQSGVAVSGHLRHTAVSCSAGRRCIAASVVVHGCPGPT